MGYSWLTMLRWFQVNSKGTQPYMDMDPFSLELPSHPGCHITLSRDPCAVGRSLLVMHFKYHNVYLSIPSSLTSLSPHPSPYNHKGIWTNFEGGEEADYEALGPRSFPGRGYSRCKGGILSAVCGAGCARGNFIPSTDDDKRTVLSEWRQQLSYKYLSCINCLPLSAFRWMTLTCCP